MIAYKKVMPYLVNDDEPGERERLQSPEDRDKFEDTTKCILCAACTTSCPVFWTAESYMWDQLQLLMLTDLYLIQEIKVQNKDLKY